MRSTPSRCFGHTHLLLSLIAALWSACGGDGFTIPLEPISTDHALDACGAAPAGEGFYKDAFINGGYGLTALVPKAFSFMGLSADALLIREESEIPVQNAVIAGSTHDANGVLLYPDEEPRFRIVFVNGGSSTNHGNSLGEDGRARLRTFYDNGGSYSGSCAGAFFAAATRASTSTPPYLGIWPARVTGSGVGAQTHAMTFDNVNHPLVQRFASLHDGKVKGLKHIGGPALSGKDTTIPEGTEIIGRNDLSGYEIAYQHLMKPGIKQSFHGVAGLIAYKANEQSGRLVINASHPEYAESGEILHLMGATLWYALEGGQKESPLKGNLRNGMPQDMSASIARLGDQQIHRWTIDVPPGTTELFVEVSGLTENVDLYLNATCPAHLGTATYSSMNEDTAPDSILVENPDQGTWHVSVHGNHTVYNGAAYTVEADWT